MAPADAASPASTISSSSSVWKDLPLRLATICLGIPALWGIWCHDAWRAAFFQCVHALCCAEWWRMTMTTMTTTTTTATVPHPQRQFGWMLYTATSVALINIGSGNNFLLGLVLVFAVATIADAPTFSAQSSQSSSPAIAWMQGLLFITLPFRAWLHVTTTTVATTTTTTGFVPTVSLLLTVWNCDTGALVTGRLLGGRCFVSRSRRQRHRNSFYEDWACASLSYLRRQLQRVSPKKSVEGLCGGMFFGAYTYAVLLPRLWHLVQQYGIPTGTSSSSSSGFVVDDDDSVWTMWMVGTALSVAAVLGDLCESALKRQYAAKDTGTLLPGHGGVLDRFDSSLVAIVVYQCYLQRYRPVRGY